MKAISFFLIAGFFSVVAHAQTITLVAYRVPTNIILNSLATCANKNIMVSDAIREPITLHLKNVSWQQALSVILRAKNLAEYHVGNVGYISPLEELLKREKVQKELTTNAPLHSKLFSLKYIRAENLLALLKGHDMNLLSSQGQVVIDNRTNTIMIHDRSELLYDLDKFIRRIDVPISQVLIEARIVNLDDNYEKSLGIRFGVTGSRVSNGDEDESNARGLNVDLPSIGSNLDHVGVALFKISEGALLDLELSALEHEGKAEIISNPKLLTSNQEPAVIEVGEELPYQESVSQGVTTTAFKKAVLSLKVTPQINPNHQIVLHLTVNQDKRSSEQVQGVPAIDTRHISTQVLVNDGETVVLGGIYEKTQLNGIERIPFLGKLPIIGILFRHRKTIRSRRELLVFVTPKIIRPSEHEQSKETKYFHRRSARGG